jgi:plasmid stabilization system protein ParE
MSEQEGRSRTKSSRNLRFTEEAVDDLRSVLEYTLTEWDVYQHDAFAARISASLEDLALFPEMGRALLGIDPSVRVRLVGSYGIYYRVSEAAVTIQRIVHGRMNPNSIVF